MSANKFDAIIIGAGSAGLGMIGLAEELGWKFLVIERNEENVGGDCLNYGCVPSKALIHISKYFHGANKASEMGLSITGKADISKILAYVHDKQALIRAHESADYLRENNVELVIGEAKFSGSNSVTANQTEYYGDKIFLCTGSSPKWVPFPGIEKIEAYTNETLFYEMKSLPERFLVVGGGPLGCEMAQAFSRFGSKVTIVNRGERILAKERPEISEILQDQLKKEGVTIINNTELLSFDGKNTACIKNRSDESVDQINFDAALISIGRTLNHSGMHLDNAKISVDSTGKLIVNEYLQTTNKSVYVLGDAAGTYQFSHGAEKMVKLIKHNLTHSFTKKKHDATDITWVTFTDPEIAKFGMRETDLQKAGINYWRQDQSFHDDDRAITSESFYGQITLFTSKEKNKLRRRILGGTMIAPNAGDLVQELHLACIAGISLANFMDKVYAYPNRFKD